MRIDHVRHDAFAGRMMAHRHQQRHGARRVPGDVDLLVDQCAIRKHGEREMRRPRAGHRPVVRDRSVVVLHQILAAHFEQAAIGTEGFGMDEFRVAQVHQIVDDQPVVDREQVHAPIVDCLLYTSPSPRDATLSRMPSSA